MNSKNTGKSNPNERPEKPHGKDLDRTYDHAKASYSNAQEIIRFVDTKTTFLVGACTVTIGFILEAVKQYVQLPADLKNHFQRHPYLVLLLEILSALSLFAGCLCIWCCVLSLVGRPPVKDLKFGHTALFPFYAGDADEEKCVEKIREGMTTDEVMKEYEIQIWNVGLILRRKLTRHRYATWMFLIQLIILTGGGIITLFCIQDG